MGLLSDQDAATDGQQPLRGVLDDQNMVDVECPHPACEETTSATAPDEETGITVTRRAALFGNYEKVRCPEDHNVFVHYCAVLR